MHPRSLGRVAHFIIIVLCQGVLIANAQTEPDTVIRVNTNLVNLFFSAIDKDARFFTSLQRADVKVYEDGIEQEILTFQYQTNRRLAIALLIDISGSEKTSLPQEKAAAKSFVDTVIRERDDQVAIISFAADPFLEQSLTSNVADSWTALDRVEPIRGVRGYQGKGRALPSGAKPAAGSLSYTSAIWDALWITCRHVMATVPVSSRRVVVIVTDGEDTSSRANLEEAIDIAIKTDTVVYVIGVGDTSIGDRVNKRTLSKLALETGGQFFAPKKDKDLAGAFDQIAKELRSQYLLTYAPRNNSADAAYRLVRVEVSSPILRRRPLRLFYRPGYYFRPQLGGK